MNSSTIRQIVDIQAQAQRLIKTKGDYNEIQQFEQYNKELKSYLQSHVKDEFVLKHINQIPDLDLDSIEVKAGLLGFLLGFLSTGMSTYMLEKNKAEKALRIIREIGNKYSSVELLVKNYIS